MLKRRMFLLVLGLLAVVAGATEVPVRVTGSRVNLRARPDTGFEVVGQASEGMILLARSFQPDWVEVLPPPDTKAYVYRAHVTDGVVNTDKLNVRAGPGVNYSSLGMLQKNMVVAVLQPFGEDWLEIEAPSICSLWIHFDYVERVRTPTAPPRAGPFVPVDPAPVNTEPVDEAEPVHGPALPSFVNLVPLDGQGKTGEQTGELRKTPLLSRRSFRFRLVQVRGNRVNTIAYLHGNEPQLSDLVGRTMTVRGPEYWVQEFAEPVVVPDEIVLRKVEP